MHDARPLVEYFPAKQSAHSVLPVAEACLPELQSAQALELAASLYFPVAQAEHVSTPPVENVPATHALQVAAPLEE